MGTAAARTADHALTLYLVDELGVTLRALKYGNPDGLAFALRQADSAAFGLSDRSSYLRYGKRAFDIVFAVFLFPAVALVILTLWCVVRRDGGTGFFGHRRIGRDGVEFQCWKIRTMVVDAETRLQDLLATNLEVAREWALDQKLASDPRVTRFGAFLRASSLDELPQIWNVLKGEMSFVGPRPVMRDELKKYGPNRAAYLSLRPGITGLWQVSGRNDVSYDARVRFDVEYTARISLPMDLRLILGTANAVLNRTGR